MTFHPALPLAIAAGFMLPLAMFSHKAMALLFALVTVVMVASHVLAKRSCPPLPPRFSVVLAAGVILATASAAWSLTPERTLSAVLPIAALAIGIAFLLGMSRHLSETEREPIRTGIILGAAVGLGLMLFEGVLARPILRLVLDVLGVHEYDNSYLLNKIKPASTIAVLLAWPLLVVLRRRFSRTVIFATFAILSVTIAAFGSTTAIAAIVVGAAVFLLARRAARATVVLLVFCR